MKKIDPLFASNVPAGSPTLIMNLEWDTVYDISFVRPKKEFKGVMFRGRLHSIKSAYDCECEYIFTCYNPPLWLSKLSTYNNGVSILTTHLKRFKFKKSPPMIQRKLLNEVVPVSKKKKKNN